MTWRAKKRLRVAPETNSSPLSIAAMNPPASGSLSTAVTTSVVVQYAHWSQGSRYPVAPKATKMRRRSTPISQFVSRGGL